MGAIERNSDSLSLALTNDFSGPVIDMSKWAFGSVHIPTGSPINSLTYYAVRMVNGARVFEPLYDEGTTNATVRSVAAPGAFPLPDSASGCLLLYIVANAAGPVVIEIKG